MSERHIGQLKDANARLVARVKYLKNELEQAQTVIADLRCKLRQALGLAGQPCRVS